MGRSQQQQQLFDPFEHGSRHYGLNPRVAEEDDGVSPVSPALSATPIEVSDNEADMTGHAPFPNQSPFRKQPSRMSRLTSSLHSGASNSRSDIKLVTNGMPGRGAKFANHSTLRALEGHSAGTTPTSLPSGISPSDGVIGIGISPSIGKGKGKGVAPHADVSPMTPVGLTSAWSPDTATTASPGPGPRPVSSIYSQITAAGAWAGTAAPSAGALPPPVPALPAAYMAARENGKAPLLVDSSAAEQDDSPFTLFAEDDDLNSAEPDKGLSAEEEKRMLASSGRQKVMLGSRDWWESDDIREPPAAKIQLSLATSSASDGLPVQQAPVLRVPVPNRAGPTVAYSVAGSIHAAAGPANSEKEEFYWEEPPPYSPSTNPSLGASTAAKYGALLSLPQPAHQAHHFHHRHQQQHDPPPHHQQHHHLRQQQARFSNQTRSSSSPVSSSMPIPSPGPVSPAFVRAMAAERGDLDMVEVSLGPAAAAAAAMAVSAGPATPAPLPDREIGTFIPHFHAIPAPGRENKTERKRRRHEKEDYLAHKIGGAWRGRGPFHQNRYFSLPGAKGRKRRRALCAAICILFLLILLGAGLGAYFGLRAQKPTRPPAAPAVVTPSPRPTTSAITTSATPTPKPTTTTTQNLFATAAGFPPIPTGDLTMVGPDNPVSDDSCVDPATLWSCSLPKDQAETVDPFPPDQPTFVMQIQWDRTDHRWNVPNPEPPSGQLAPDSDTQSGAVGRRDSSLALRTSPAAPSFDDMWFLGNTTDGIMSDDKAGEPTPFYATMLNSPDGSVGPNAKLRRRPPPPRRVASSSPSSASSPGTAAPIAELPAPDLNPDGTGAPAVMAPLPVQQPLRLFDRGLPTEHYGFYTYFRRTIYVESVTAVNDTGGKLVQVDQNGGALLDQAKYLVTWGSVRYRVRISTRAAAASARGRKTLIAPDGSTIDGSPSLTRPGTMPLPVALSLDLHGGDPGSNYVWHHTVTSGGAIDTSQPGLVNIDMGPGIVNPAHEDPNMSLGGVDGGTGGCRCVWTNYLDG